MPGAYTRTAADEIASGDRFEFGENWSRFLSVLDEARIAEAMGSLERMLGRDSLRGKTFLDIGSGSGLFSLAARRLGARVRSFDYDAASVSCTAELKRRYFPNDAQWTVEQGSVLDEAYIESLGTFDVVYSWGVLHHTGDQWKALEHAASRVAPGGALFIALYNDQGGASRRWLVVKRLYVAAPRILRPLISLAVYLPLELRSFLIQLLRGRPGEYVRYILQYSKRGRGMSWWRDRIDWIGGYPFEVSAVDEVFDFCAARGFTLVKLKTVSGGHGCNEFVLRRS